MDREGVGGLVVVAAAVEVPGQGLHHGRVLPGVVVDELPEPLVDERLQFPVIVAGSQDAVEAELVEERRAVALAGVAAHVQGALCLLVVVGDVVRGVGRGAHPDRSGPCSGLPGELLVQRAGVWPLVGDEDDVVRAAGQQRAHAHGRGRPPHGLCEGIVGGPVRPLHHDDVVAAVQVVSDCLGPGVGARLVRPCQEILGQLAVQPQLRFGQIAQVRHFQGERRGGVFQREHGVLVGLVPRVDQGQHAQDLAVRADQGDQPVPYPHRPGLFGDGVQHLVLAHGVRFGIGDGAAGAGPGPQPTEAVLDQRGKSGEPVQCAGDSLLAATRGSDVGHESVNGSLVAQLSHHRDQLPLEGCAFLPQPVQLQRVLALAAVCEGDRQRGSGVPDEHGEQESLDLGGREAGRDHEVAVEYPRSA